MKSFVDFTTQESGLITPLTVAGQPLAGAVVVVEDQQDLTESIAAALNLGLMIFLGTPTFKPSGNSGAVMAVMLHQDILIGEVPAIWRNVAGKVHCQDAARIVAATLHGHLFDNYQRLQVIDGQPLGTFKGDPKTNPNAFQYYLLKVEVPLKLTAS